MNAIDEGIRKAAVFVAALDCSAADSLLDRLPDGQARQIRDAMIAMSEVDAGEQRRVRDEFLRVRSGTPNIEPKSEPAGIELDGNLAMLGPAFAKRSQPRPDSAEKKPSPPFTFLSGAEGGDLADALRNERPQTIALVLAHLPPHRASEVLTRLTPSTQAEVIRRLANLEEADPSIVFEVEQALKSRVAQRWGIRLNRMVGMTAVQGILDASDSALSRTITQTLSPDVPAATRRPPVPPRADLESEPSPAAPPVDDDFEPEIPFEALPQFDANSLATLFHEAGRDVAGAALLGAPSILINRVLRILPKSEAKWLRRQLNEPGPIRLRDVEDARRRILQLAAELHRTGRIETAFSKPRMTLTA